MDDLEFLREIYYFSLALFFFILTLWLVLFAYTTNKSEKYNHYYPLARRLLLWMPIGILVSNGIFGFIIVESIDSLNKYFKNESLEILKTSLIVAGVVIGPFFFSFFGMLVGGLWAWRGYRKSLNEEIS